MKAAPLRFFYLGNVYIKKSLGFISTIGEEREREREKEIHLLPFFLVPARQPIFIAFDCPFGVF